MPEPSHRRARGTDPATPLLAEFGARPRGRRRATRRRRDQVSTVALRGARILAGLLSVAVFLGSAYAWATLRTFTQNVSHVDAIVAQPQHHDIDGTAQNILLVGDDHRPPGASAALLKQLSTGQDGGGVNTDTMMILHIPADGSQATAISFPRDSWVNVPGLGMSKLNSAFAFGTQNGGGDQGGARLLIKVIQSMTGLSIDHFVRVSLVGFYNIASALGPIKVCVNAATQDPYSGTNLPAGVSYLNAQQSLSFVRQRHNLPRGDLDREVRQQYFLSSAFRKVATAGTLLNPLKLQRLLTAVSSSLETDPGLDLLKFAQQFQNLSAGNVHFATVPITGTPTINVGGSDVSIVAIDYAALPAFISAIVGPSAAYTKAQVIAPAQVAVTVVNAADTPGAAALGTAALTGLGFRTTAPGSAAPTSLTTIEYPAGMEAAAKTVAAHVPGAVVLASASVTRVTLTLGTDGHHVSTPRPAAPAPSGTTPPAGSVTTTPPAASVTPTSPATPTTPARAFSASDCIN
ncbi:MAG: LCP family protein [Actinomycetota bacterium]|nr:LCP family protein [Actinomycetota bacterium]